METVDSTDIVDMHIIELFSKSSWYLPCLASYDIILHQCIVHDMLQPVALLLEDFVQWELYKQPMN